MPGKHIFITGGTGFIGSHLVRRLIRDGNDVHVFHRAGSSFRRIADSIHDATLWQGDLGDFESVLSILKAVKPDTIYHLAGSTDVRILDDNWTQIDKSIADNVVGSLNLVRAAQLSGSGIQRFIRTGGLEEYGRGPVPYDENQREAPVSPYSASQVAVTHYCRMLSDYTHFRMITLRPALVYGPDQSDAFFIPSLIRHCLRDADFIMTSGEQYRDFIYISDLVDALIRCGQAALESDEIINVGSGGKHKIIHVAQRISELTGSRAKFVIGDLAARPSEIQELYCKIEKAQALLKWSPRVSMEDGLQQTIQWFKKNSIQ